MFLSSNILVFCKNEWESVASDTDSHSDSFGHRLAGEGMLDECAPLPGPVLIQLLTPEGKT